MIVEKLMSKDVKSCLVSDSLAAAAHVMWESDCGCVPVVDTHGRIVGIVTDRDICMAAFLNGKALQELPIRDVMSKQIFACRPEDNVTDAERTMQKAQVRRLPVTDKSGRLVGLLSLNDIAISAEQSQSARSPEIALDEVALTLSAVCHHRGAKHAVS